MSDFTVSVVIPFYNRAHFLERTLNSILNQTLRPIEVLLVDNGSDLEQLKIVKNILLKKKYNVLKITLLHTSESGNANFARNLGYSRAEGDYVAFLDSDDWWNPNHLEQSITVLNNSTAVAVYSGAIFHTKDGIFKKYSIDVNQFDNPFDLILSSEGHMAVTPSYIVNKRLMNKDIQWDTRLKRHQDFDYFANIFYNTSGWCYSPGINVNVDWKDGGTKASNIDFDSLILFYKKWRNKIPNNIKKQYLLNRLYFCTKNNAPSYILRYYRDEIKSYNYFSDQYYRLRCYSIYVELYNHIVDFLDRSNLKQPIKALYRKSKIIKNSK